MKSFCTSLIGAGLSVCMAAAFFSAFSQEGQAKERIVFGEQRIEGKIRRPQLVLIKAEQRPDFQPMVMQSISGNTRIVEGVPSEILDESPYNTPFQFDGTRISNYTP